jgi:very-short-patch-repair endonuclease
MPEAPSPLTPTLSPPGRGGKAAVEANSPLPGGERVGRGNAEVARKRLTPIARKLRANRTEAEARLWYYLRARRLEGEKFVRQLQIDRYVADFACRTARLAIELDGGQHDAERDSARTEILETHGYRVLRYWNHDVLGDTHAVLEAIRHELLIARDRPE